MCTQNTTKSYIADFSCNATFFQTTLRRKGSKTFRMNVIIMEKSAWNKSACSYSKAMSVEFTRLSVHTPTTLAHRSITLSCCAPS